MDVVIILAIISLLLNVYLVYRGIILLDTAQEILQQKNDIIDKNYILFEKLLSDLRNIDLRGAFESDDEVGSTFAQIKEMIEFYRKLIEDDQETNG